MPPESFRPYGTSTGISAPEPWYAPLQDLWRHGLGNIGPFREAPVPAIATAPVPGLDQKLMPSIAQHVAVGSPEWEARFPDAAAQRRAAKTGTPPSIAEPLEDQPVAAATITNPRARIPPQDLQGLLTGAFRPEPAWQGSGPGGSYTQGDYASDAQAHNFIDRKYGAAFDRIDAAEARRPDPFDEMVAGRKKTMALESLMPLAELDPVTRELVPYKTRMTVDGKEFEQEHAPSAGRLTRGQATAIEEHTRRKAAEMSPKDRLSIAQHGNRMGELNQLAARQKALQDAAAAGKLSPEQLAAAQEELKDLLLEAAKRGALAEGDYSGLARLLYPAGTITGVPD